MDEITPKAQHTQAASEQFEHSEKWDHPVEVDLRLQHNVGVDNPTSSFTPKVLLALAVSVLCSSCTPMLTSDLVPRIELYGFCFRKHWPGQLALLYQRRHWAFCQLCLDCYKLDFGQRSNSDNRRPAY